MVAYNKEYTSVRYVTAVAGEQGRRLRYTDVIDVARARKETIPASHAYTQERPPAQISPAS